MSTLSSLARSRKVLLALLGVVSTLVLHYLNIDPEVWAAIDALLVTVIGAIAYEDAAAKGAPRAPENVNLQAVSADGAMRPAGDPATGEGAARIQPA